MATLLHHISQSPAFWIIAPNFVTPTVLFIVSLLELRSTEIHPSSSALPESLSRTSDDAAAAGIRFEPPVVCTFGRELAFVRFSQDRRILAVTRLRTTLGRVAHQTWLFSHSPEGRILASTDGTTDGDRSGFLRVKRAIRRPFNELVAMHTERLLRYGMRAAPFSEGTPIESYHAIESRRVELMVSRGIARYTNENRTRWRYTARGAARNTIGVTVELLESIGNRLGVYGKPLTTADQER